MQNTIFTLIEKEKQRQESTINLIASENYASTDVLRATGSVLTNKYAEGYPGHRYYGGCNVIDEIELYAIAQGKKLFNAEHLNVQPHSGASANFAAYFALLNPGDTVLGMNLSAGGHLTHGHKINFSGKIYNFIPANEVWIDNDITTKERKFVILHELFERALMKKGSDYDSAHIKASEIEKELRLNPKKINSELKKLGW